MSYMGVDPGDLTPDEMYGRIEDQTETMGNESGAIDPLVLRRDDCDCQGDGLCMRCAVEDDATMAVFLKRVHQERAA